MNSNLIQVVKRVPVFKQVIFLLIFLGIFTYIYKKSDKRGFVRWSESVKLAIMISFISLGLIPGIGIAQESKTVDPNTSSRSASSQIERVINS